MFQVMVTDDEGKRVPMVRVSPILLAGRSAPLPRSVYNKVRVELAKHSWRDASFSRADWKRALAYGWVFTVVPFGTMLVMFWSMKTRGTPLTAELFVLVPVLFALEFRLLARFSMHITSDFVRRLYIDGIVKSGHCASCGYSLRPRPEVPAVERCPECGAVWRRRDASESDAT